MSQEKVRELRECFSLFNDRGVESAMDAFGHLLDEEFGLSEAAGMPDRDSYDGRGAFIANLRKLEAEFDELRIEPLEIIDRGDALVSIVSMTGRGRASQAPVEITFAQVWSLRNGKVVSLRDYATKAEALAALGHGH